MKLIVVLHNIRSAYNVGAILRTADGFGVEKAIFSGYTPRVHDDSLLPHLREKLERQIAKTALGAEESVPILNVADLAAEIRDLKEEGWVVLGLENNIRDARLCLLSEVGKKLRGVRDEVGADEIEEMDEVGAGAGVDKSDELKVVLMLGEEVEGISKDFYDLIDVFAEIPMKGRKESFNVSVAAGIAMWELSKDM